MAQRWVVTGGAGYLGAHVVAALLEAGVEVVVVDDLSTGRRERVPGEALFVRASVADLTTLDSVLRGASGVVHLAALTSAPESIWDPLAYYRANVADVALLLSGMVRHDVRRLVFTSSAAVYGGRPLGSDAPTLAERVPLRPTTPYGWTKLMGERLVAGVAEAAGISTISLRCFNVLGAAVPALVDRKPGGVLARVLSAQSRGLPVTVHGLHHRTPDGSAVRDYVHAADVAAAHLAAVTRLTAGGNGSAVYDVGTGRGTSVLDLLDTVAAVTGRSVTWLAGEPRPGDPGASVADPSAITDELGWRPSRGLEDAVRSAWRAVQLPPAVRSRDVPGLTPAR